MISCYCDYDRPAWARESCHVARKEYKCSECGRFIRQDELYTRHVGMWDREIKTYRWCAHCTDVAAHIRAHVPCFCWGFGDMLSDALTCADEAQREAPGLWMEVARKVVAVRRQRKKQEQEPQP